MVLSRVLIIAAFEPSEPLSVVLSRVQIIAAFEPSEPLISVAI